MPKFIQIRDTKTRRLLMRSTADAREIIGRDPERFSFADPKSKLRPIIHDTRADDEGEPDEPVTAAAPPAKAAEASPSTKPAKRAPSQATNEKRAAALAKGRATAAANRAARAQAPAAP